MKNALYAIGFILLAGAYILFNGLQQANALTYVVATLQSTSSITFTTATSTSISTNCALGPNPAAAAFVRTNGSTQANPSSTIAGQTMPLIAQMQEGTGLGNNAWMYIFALANPPTGKSTTTVTFASSQTAAIFFACLDNTNQSHLVDVTRFVTSTASLNFTSTITPIINNDLILEQARSYASGNVTSSNAILIDQITSNGGAFFESSSSINPPATYSNIMHSAASGQWSVSMVAIEGAPRKIFPGIAR